MLRTIRNVSLRCGLALAVSSASACGGSQQSLPSPALPAAGGGAMPGATFSQVTVVIKLPQRASPGSSVRRRPLFVSPSIQSVKVTVSAPGSAATSVTSNVVCSAAVPPVCSATASILAPVQKQDTFTVVSYDGANAAGNVLSRGSTVYAVPAGATVQIPIVLQGIVASVLGVTVANPNPPTGTSSSSGVTVTAADADNNIIVGTYQVPVTVQLFENDPEGVFSFAQGGAIVTTGTVTGSSTPATVYLKAKSDTTTPDDATIVATVGNAPYVPGTSGSPSSSTIGEITTACPATSPQCVFYPNGAQIIANPTNINQWGTFSVFPGTAQDPGGGASIWNVPSTFGVINQFNTLTDTFSNVSATAPLADATVDIAGTFWGAVPDQSVSTAVTDQSFSSNGTLLATYPLTTLAAQQAFGGGPLVSSAFDSTGQLWAIDNGYLYAIDPSTGSSTGCSFQSTDQNFANPTISTLAVAGNVVWVGVSGAADGNTYLFKVPAQITASGCNLTTLETAANQFALTAQAGAFPVDQIVVNAAGAAYALLLSSVWKIAPGGQAVKLIDTGTAVTQALAAGTLDPSGASLYLVDPVLGVLYKASATTPSANPLPSIVLPPVFGISGNSLPALYDVPFFTIDGTLWLGAAPFDNAALPFSLLGTVSSLGGLDEIRLPRVTFAARAVGSPRTREELLRMLRSQRVPQRKGLRRGAAL